MRIIESIIVSIIVRERDRWIRIAGLRDRDNSTEFKNGFMREYLIGQSACNVADDLWLNLWLTLWLIENNPH